MNNRDKQVLQKICGHIESVLKYCEGCYSLAEFQSDSMRVEACVFNLMQVGELAKTSLSDECKNVKLRSKIFHGHRSMG